MTKVLMAMSGGIDSSAAAALLQEEGYEVIGVTMIVHDDFSELKNAEIIAERLNIPLEVLDLKDIFSQKIIKYFIDEYAAARTPNPCVMCNKEIKFGVLLTKALEMNCDYLATGHYARIERGYSGNGRFLLKKGKDVKKDQSYMLYQLSQQQLKHILFPLGDYTKKDVINLAREKGLVLAERKESQEICFIPDNDYAGYLDKNSPDIASPGPIVDENGEKLGRHQGLYRYTIGQRRGLGISLPYPVYVIQMDRENNALIVGKDNNVYGEKCIVEDVNWIAIEKLVSECEMMTKIRYNSPARKALISPLNNNSVKVVFTEKQRAITPGQSAVFYQGDTVIGGGIIN